MTAAPQYKLNSDIQIHPAATPELQRQVYQLRYQVFSQELGDTRWANEVQKTYQDPYDNKRSILLMATQNQQTIATVRGIFRREGEYLSDAPFNFEKLATRFCKPVKHIKEHTCFVTRAAVLAPFRRQGLCEQLYCQLEDIAIAQGAKYCIADVASNKPHVQQLFLQQGFQRYQHKVAFTNNNAIQPETWLGDFFVKEI
ncbi:MAG: GNAT family N-acetyltransferase [Methylococcales bacterium]|jgi:N-acyl-L-homoserine lactone synthetase|nr:GNAT family N-acetyltransferase [Methylococcales bacterium]MBT7445905.1 GNAT family N-acetyltransferase [Methylococcales bacterium]